MLDGRTLKLSVHSRRAAPDARKCTHPADPAAWQALWWSRMGAATGLWWTSVQSARCNRSLQLCLPGMHLDSGFYGC